VPRIEHAGHGGERVSARRRHPGNPLLARPDHAGDSRKPSRTRFALTVILLPASAVEVTMASVRSVLLFVVAAVMVGGVALTHISASASAQDSVSLETPAFVQVGKRYAFTWAGGGPAQTYTVKQRRADGWVLVEVADENTNPVYLTPGELPTRWLNAAMAISIQEMRPHPY
jgi:hypothetical protein